MAGLVPANIRQIPPEDTELPDDISVEVADDDGDGDLPIMDDAGHVIEIEHGDGSVTVSLDGSPLETANENKGPEGWFDNLVGSIDASLCGGIAEDLLRGIRDDLQTRTDWIEAREQGLRLLGLKIEMPGIQGASDGAPVEGMSKVRHPLLLEAVLRFQANARSELLPTDGPVKIRNDDSDAGLTEDNLANVLEQDMNHYLTVTAPEYYPDTDRMLFKLGFGGTAFKKVYFCPLRSRPVSESVDAEDLIVNNAATDLGNAKRITHRVLMRPSTVKRLQILGVYKNVDLSTPIQAELDSFQREEKEQQGIAADAANPEDRDREIYECYCELDIKGLEHQFEGKDSGLEIPYRVTIDVSSRQVLSIVRNYNEDDQELPHARKVFVKYTFVPGFGFYDIGLLNILGNTTNAITAAWREMLDNGMYANFPGFLVTKQSSRQNTNIFRIPPGGGAQIDTGGQNISQAVMPLPYNTGHMQPLMALVTDMAQTGMRIGGTSEMQVGEGKADAPVGTTLAMIEQATKVLDSVHKRLHASQAEEFRLLVDVFREHPEAFYKQKCKSSVKWDEQSFLQALSICELTPQADPNTASHAQRIMKVMGLVQLATQYPQLFNPLPIAEAAIRTLGYSHPEQFFAAPDQMARPQPKEEEIQGKLKIQQQEADTKATLAKAKIAEVEAKKAQGAYAPSQGLGGGQPEDTPTDVMTAKAKLLDAETKAKIAQTKQHDVALEDQNRDQDRQSKERIAVLDAAKELTIHHETQQAAQQEVDSLSKDVGLSDDA